MSTTRKRTILFCIAAAAIAAAAFMLFGWKGMFLQREFVNKEMSWGDLEVRSKNGLLILYRDNTEVWRTDWDWSVQDYCLADLDRDGQNELAMLVWKRGSYGPHRPFWVMHNDIRLEQHVFVYAREPERTTQVRALFMSSSIGKGTEEMGTDGVRLVLKRNGHYSVFEREVFGLKLLNEEAPSADMICLGDQLLHLGLLAEGMRTDDYSYLYGAIEEDVQKADLASLNAETPLVADKALVSDYPRFGSPAGIAQAVSAAGFDLVSTANNHALDQGMAGIDTTVRAYEDANVVCVGTHPQGEEAEDPSRAVRFVTRNGIRLAFLAFTYGTNGLNDKSHPYAVESFRDEDRMIRALDLAAEHADAVIVFAHWGTEYESEPDPEQRRLAALFAQHGADVVIGTHPHVLQPYEVIGSEGGHRTLVYYSLGNLISAQKEEACRRGGAACFTLVKTTDRVAVLDADLKTVVTEAGRVRWE